MINDAYDDDDGRDCDGATTELVARDLIAAAAVMPLATGAVTTHPTLYTSYPHKYGMVWMHDSHVSVEFQKSKCEKGPEAGSHPSARHMAEAWLNAHPGGQKTGRWPNRYVIRYNH